MNMKSGPTASRIKLTCFKYFIPITICVVSNLIEDVKGFTTDQHYTADGKDFLATKSVGFFYVGVMIQALCSFQMKIR